MENVFARNFPIKKGSQHEKGEQCGKFDNVRLDSLIFDYMYQVTFSFGLAAKNF